MRGAALRARFTPATPGCPSRGEPGLGGRLQGRSGPEASESQRHVEHTSRCGKGEAERNTGCAVLKDSDHSRPMRKSKLGGPETCGKTRGPV